MPEGAQYTKTCSGYWQD